MKFFLKLALCYRPDAVAMAPLQESNAASTTTQAGAPPCPVGGQAPCVRRNKTKTAPWRPALSVISEDGVLLGMETRTERTLPCEKRLTSRPISKAEIRSCFSHGDKYDGYSSRRKKSIPIIIPAFSQTGFMF